MYCSDCEALRLSLKMILESMMIKTVILAFFFLKQNGSCLCFLGRPIVENDSIYPKCISNKVD